MIGYNENSLFSRTDPFVINGFNCICENENLINIFFTFDLRINVISGNHYLHCIEPGQFLDSPEFESSKTGTEDKFKVSLIAATPCRYIFWQRQSLEFLLIKETFLASILSLILARDITNKLYAMNEKVKKIN
jgi:hypothetical protein